jgi:hypothetical protein
MMLHGQLNVKFITVTGTVTDPQAAQGIQITFHQSSHMFGVLKSLTAV